MALLALAVRGAPGRVGWVPVAVDTTVAAPSPTSAGPSPVSYDGRAVAASNSTERHDEAAMLPHGASYTELPLAAAAQSTLTTMSRPSKVTSAVVRTASSNKLSPTGTSTTTFTTTVTVSGRRPFYTPSKDHVDDAEIKGCGNVVFFLNRGYTASIATIEMPARNVTHSLHPSRGIWSSKETVYVDSSADARSQCATRERSSQVGGGFEQIHSTVEYKCGVKGVLSAGVFWYPAQEIPTNVSTIGVLGQLAPSAPKLAANPVFTYIHGDWEHNKDQPEASDFISLL
ncbi:hypothetical protein IF1G_05493 [Cordyceps javanica]|uniref:Uncharacterized protein n=1 Tax=Cordyceps javanica TaxID=43265 RepID=A0A545V1T4_9HYPO|nr:hypothetical protein IF1G_05493 [Cordyceps javanica]TQW07132.1 hypothetical protein IF2G_05516 [Cordyceps javanica]